ncbi:uncharacterized protein LOC131353857 [Hemibagrus wyckioides]|uniref:uncharacterized protein LOC131353857 n=1 Tax=Hemibagrus wyckioides TaxID=337641 RepID=UPI00266B80C2|nr:uncharacterized protein LOC131353857 [Hemibagrus wyckioides]
MKRWIISTKGNTGTPAERPVEESGKAPPSERPSTSGTDRDRWVHEEDIHKQSGQPYSKCRKYREEFIQYGFTCVIINDQIINWCVHTDCRLKGNRETKEITAYTGVSVLLPCSCTDPHSKPETYTWEKYTNDWVQISPESDQYKERFQLVNDHSSGNLSLLISHLTEEDGGDYRCNVKGAEYRYIRLTVKGCRLKGNRETEEITAFTGGSVLLPCSCTDLHIKPETFTWEKYTNRNNWVQISPESDQYKERFQLVNNDSSGNLSLLISHLTVEDGRLYKCNVNEGEYRYIRLTVKGK